MTNSFLAPIPRRIVVNGKTKWEPEFLNYSWGTNVATVYYWEKNYHFDLKDEADNFILGYLFRASEGHGF